MRIIILLSLLLTSAFSQDLITPEMIIEKHAPAKRMGQRAIEYKRTEVYHTLYLPTDWVKGEKYPVIVEYTGNKRPHSSGEVKSANLGYGMSGGKRFIWIVMPYIEKGHQKNTVIWMHRDSKYRK